MSPETVYKEFSLKENPKAKEMRDAEAVKLKKEGYSIQTYYTVKVDAKTAEVFYSLLASKKKRRQGEENARKRSNHTRNHFETNQTA